MGARLSGPIAAVLGRRTGRRLGIAPFAVLVAAACRIRFDRRAHR